jgi:hypothetical protein
VPVGAAADLLHDLVALQNMGLDLICHANYYLLY